VNAELEVACAVLRANAHERLDRTDRAVEEMIAIMRAAGAAEVERALRAVYDVAPLRKTMPRARDALGRQGGTTAPRRSWRPVIVWLVVTATFLVLAIVTDPSATLVAGKRLDVLFLVIAVAAIVPAALALLRRRRATRT
jgi:hypothetical protein